MSLSTCSERGLGLVEVIIAMFITTVAVMAILALQPSAWTTAGKSDYMGRAAGILHEELERQEAIIMNPCCAVATGTTGPVAVLASGQATALAGDAQFNVTRTITLEATNVWRVTVRVAWANHPGISESLVVTRQQPYLFPAGCTPSGTTCS
jgi:hypothetical protein